MTNQDNDQNANKRTTKEERREWWSLTGPNPFEGPVFARHNLAFKQTVPIHLHHVGHVPTKSGIADL